MANDTCFVHISLTGKDYIRVTWVTEDKEVLSIVKYGKIFRKYDTIEKDNIQY
ncbi:hypothetical protein J1N35_006335 [Gossypium stocksii]|uniref:Uncharacterized protein n=1 Tax=Gossypium stocksii TaxID=47602 RepID=A0A9D3WH13_9ROSI|nr:hypothetical protein J1N35_006335 [Gossypium stocksii]